MKLKTINYYQLLILVVLTTILISSCTAIPSESGMMKDLEGVKMSKAELGIRLNEFGKYFAGKVEESADEIILKSDNRKIKMNALEWKINAIPRAMESLVILDPVASGVDIYAFSAQMENFFKRGNGKGLFGDYQYVVINACEDIMNEAEILANDFRDAKYRQETMKSINDWVEDNPINNLNFYRRSTFKLMAKTLGAEEYTLGSTVGSMAEGIYDIRQQITTYTEFLPKHVKWQAQFTAYELLGDSTVEKTFGNFDRVVNSAERITKVVEETPVLVKDIQQSSFAEINRQRALTLSALANERAILIEAISAERAAILKDINQQREETLEKFDELAERTISKSSILAGDLIDKIFFRTLILLLIVFVGGVVALKIIKK